MARGDCCTLRLRLRGMSAAISPLPLPSPASTHPHAHAGPHLPPRQAFRRLKLSGTNLQYQYLSLTLLLAFPLTMAVDGTDWAAGFGPWTAGNWAELVVGGTVVYVGQNYLLQVGACWSLGEQGRACGRWLQLVGARVGAQGDRQGAAACGARCRQACHPDECYSRFWRGAAGLQAGMGRRAEAVPGAAEPGCRPA